MNIKTKPKLTQKPRLGVVTWLVVLCVWLGLVQVVEASREKYDVCVGCTSGNIYTQMDTWQGRNSDPLTLHKYLYTHNDPVNNTDPSGYLTLGGVLGGIGSFARSAAAGTGAFISFAGKVVGAGFVVSKVASIQLKREVKTCRVTKGQKCRIPNLVVIGSNHKEAQEHIADTQQGRGSNGIPVSPRVTYKKGANQDRSWLKRTSECSDNVTSVTGKSCDEWPFATTANAGRSGYNRNQVSLRLIDHSDNVDSGRVWGRAVRRGQDGDKYTVVPIGPTSFYFSNGRFGF